MAPEISPKDQEWFDKMKAWKEADLDPELEPWLEESGSLGTVLKHPLVFEIPYMFPGRANEALVYKKDALEKAIAERDWFTYIGLHERPYRVDALLRLTGRAPASLVIAGMLPLKVELTDAEYWDLVGYVWTDSENIWQNLDEWETLWSSDRPGREQHVMDDEEREFLANLPDLVTAYRGAVLETNEDGMSYSLDFDRAAWFAKRFNRDNDPVVIEVTVPRDDILAYFDGRGEEEVVLPLWDPDITIVRYHHLAEDKDENTTNEKTANADGVAGARRG